MNGIAISSEVGSQHFDPCTQSFANGAYAFIEMVCTTIRQIVPGDRRDDHIVQSQSRSCLGNSSGFVELDGLGFPFQNRTETARPCADISQDHESGRFVRPAFCTVGALGTFTDRFQSQIRNHI